MACLGYPASLLWVFPLYLAASLSLLAMGRVVHQAWLAILFSSGSLALATLLYLWFPGVLSRTLQWGAFGAGFTLVLMLVTGVWSLMRQPRDRSPR